LTAEAREAAKNPRLGSYTIEGRDEQGELVALFQGLAYRKSEKLNV
jgi:acyl-CoA thioesterase